MEDNVLIKIIEALIYLKDKEVYTPINKGDFKKAPELEGYFVDFNKIFKKKIYLILNNSNKYDIERNVKELEGSYFIIFNLYKVSKDLETFINSLDKHSNILIKLFENLFTAYNVSLEDKKDEKNNQYNLPYGYTRNSEGKIIIDKKEADLVRKVFTMYSKLKSMKKVADSVRLAGFLTRSGERVEFGVISNILHDYRYISKDLPQAIIPMSLFNKTQGILSRNVKDNTQGIKYF